MLQKPWFKVFVWFLTIFFFFLASGVIISILKPGPTEGEVMQFMMGMMSAMENSMMGISMSLEQHSELAYLIALSSSISLPVIAICIVFGLIIRLRKQVDKNV